MLLRGIKICSGGSIESIEYDTDIILQIRDFEGFVSDSGTNEFEEVESFLHNGIYYVVCGYTEGYLPNQFSMQYSVTYGDIIVYGILDSDSREVVSIRISDFLHYMEGEDLMNTIIEDELYHSPGDYDYSDPFIANEDSD